MVIDPIVQILVDFYRRCIVLLDVIVFFIRATCVYIRLTYRCFVPAPQRSIAGEIALVTGTAHGIGRELAYILSQLGAVVICVDIDEAGNLETCKNIQNDGGVAFNIMCDVSDRIEVEKMANKVRTDIGDVTILINNAGYRTVLPFLQFTPRQICRHIDVNLMGQMWMIRSFLPRMLAIDRGTLVCMCALAAYGGFPNMLPFAATKFAVRGLMEGLYLELRQENPEHKIHLMTVSPFIVDTGQIRGPIVRIPGLVNVVPVKEAARTIVINMRRNETVIFIPPIYYYIQNLIRILPLKVQLLLTDFVDTGVEINYDNERTSSLVDLALESGALDALQGELPTENNALFNRIMSAQEESDWSANVSRRRRHATVASSRPSGRRTSDSSSLVDAYMRRRSCRRLSSFKVIKTN